MIIDAYHTEYLSLPSQSTVLDVFPETDDEDNVD